METDNLSITRDFLENLQRSQIQAKSSTRNNPLRSNPGTPSKWSPSSPSTPSRGRRGSRVQPEGDSPTRTLGIDDDAEMEEVCREFILQNKAPFWNELSQVYQLDFGGRVTQESAKNFQIEHQGNQVSEQTFCLFPFFSLAFRFRRENL